MPEGGQQPAEGGEALLALGSPGLEVPCTGFRATWLARRLRPTCPAGRRATMSGIAPARRSGAGCAATAGSRAPSALLLMAAAVAGVALALTHHSPRAAARPGSRASRRPALRRRRRLRPRRRLRAPTATASPSPSPSPTWTGPASYTLRLKLKQRDHRAAHAEVRGRHPDRPRDRSEHDLHAHRLGLQRPHLQAGQDHLRTRSTCLTGALAGYTGTVHGGPVEAAVSADRKSVYVSNYSMYGPGFSRPGDDVGSPGQYDRSFVYRIRPGQTAYRPGDTRGLGAQVPGHHAGRQVPAGEQLDLVQPQRGQRGPPSPGPRDLPRALSARHRRGSAVALCLRGRHGQHEHRSCRPAQLQGVLDTRSRLLAASPVSWMRPVAGSM